MREIGNWSAEIYLGIVDLQAGITFPLPPFAKGELGGVFMGLRLFHRD